MPPLQPWLTRLLVAWAASVAASGVVLQTADNRYKPKPKRKKRRLRARDDDDGEDAREREARRKKAPPAVLLGTVAKKDAAEGYTASLTWGEWREAVKLRGRGMWRFVTGQGPEGAIDKDGARIPDEITDKDGKRVAGPSRKAKAKGNAKRKAPARSASGRRRGKRQQASLFDSAKESLRQVVKEEASKAVDEKVEQAGLKKVADTLKDASEKVGETAKDVAQRVKESGVDEKLQSAGRSFLKEAKRTMGRIGESIQSATASLEGPGERGVDRALDGEIIDVGADGRIADVGGSDAAAAAVRDGAADVADDARPDLGAMMSVLDGAAPPHDGAAPSPHDSSSTPEAAAISTRPAVDVVNGGADDVSAGLSADDVVDKVTGTVGEGAKFIGSGVQKLGSFLSGPGNPGYQRTSSRRASSGDIVEAKDAPQTPEPPSTPEPTPPSAPKA